MIVTLNIPIPIAGTRVQVATGVTPIMCQWITVMGAIANAGNIFHGDASVSSTRGQAVAAGQGAGAPQYPPIGGAAGINGYDLRELYVDAANNGDIAQITYLKR